MRTRRGSGIIAPSINDYGTPEQKERFLGPTLRAEISWCLGMSEPGAGSDLASLKTRAELVGDEFVVNGQKVWTSGAHHADWCLCFVRTDPSVPKHKGISALIIDTTTPGVECRPFPELSDPDWCDFNEVFFTDVRVPKENLVGPLNGGWPITQGSLAHERAMLWIDVTRTTCNARCARWWSSATGPCPAAAGSATILATATRSRASTSTRRRCSPWATAASPSSCSARRRRSTRSSSCSGASRCSARLLFGTEALGVDGLDLDRLGPQDVARRRRGRSQYLRSFSGTIPGGTSEIQRNIIAERVLGLPR